MKAYNEQWIYNREILGQAERWYQQRLLSDEQITTIRHTYPVEFRQTNSFIEIGLFLFTTVAILACYLLPASIFSALLGDQTTYGLFNVAFGIGIGVVGQLLINRRLLYRNGVDNAFVATLAGFLAFGMNQLVPNELSLSTHCLITLPLLLLILWYYGDTLIAFFALATFYTFIFDGLIKYNWGKDVLPFVLMGVSTGLYLAVKQILRQNPKQVYYTDPLNLAQWIALIVLAASGNYYVVREFNGLLSEPSFIASKHKETPEISLWWLFWLLTFVIPTIYLWQGLAKKNRMLVILGVIGWIAAVVTVHEYKTLVPLNAALAIGGLVLILIAVAGIQYLREPKYGFTDVADEDSPNDLLTNMSTLASMQAAAGAHRAPENGVRFGGGEFGGGGSEGKY
ncbi:hypothetical protein [Spirosoma sp. KNUC1025]|uniref:hypothetical protein n=1 Tax=Spirosoma sp. KNUC1025 TaxID=2894082 RepID=UPI003870D197|nr:hypothetical protein LN737_25115 [Spirosoma sp. KNUC1025]